MEGPPVDPAENLARMMLDLIDAALPPHHLDEIVCSCESVSVIRN